MRWSRYEVHRDHLRNIGVPRQLLGMYDTLPAQDLPERRRYPYDGSHRFLLSSSTRDVLDRQGILDVWSSSDNIEAPFVAASWFHTIFTVSTSKTHQDTPNEASSNVCAAESTASAQPISGPRSVGADSTCWNHVCGDPGFLVKRRAAWNRCRVGQRGHCTGDDSRRPSDRTR